MLSLRPKVNYYIWMVLAFLNTVMVAIGAAQDDWGRVGFSGFFLIVSLIAIAVWSYVIDTNKDKD